MDENILNNIDYSGYYPFMNEISDVNLPEINKKRIIIKNFG